MSRLPDVHFGRVHEKPRDWREELKNESDDDDEELSRTPPDVVALLGFDPAKEN